MSSISKRETRGMGLKTRVLEAGPADADEAVVFLHGQPGSAEDWEDLLRRVGRFARAVALDWPGWGDAECPGLDAWDFSAGTSATFVGVVLRELDIRRAHLVMHDLGGVGLLWGLANPDRWASAVLIDTGVLIDFRWHPVARLMRMPLVGRTMLRMATRSGFGAFIRFYNPQPRKLPDQIIDRWWRGFSLPTRRAMLAFYRATPEKAMERLAEPLAALDIPALVLWGAHDPAVPVKQAALQRESFPSAEVLVLEESGHWPYLDDPERAADAIVPFLQRQVRQRDSSNEATRA